MPLKPLSASNGIWLGKSSEENELRSKLERRYIIPQKADWACKFTAHFHGNTD